MSGEGAEWSPVMARGTPRRVCFITTEFHGLFRNGGIGTANTGLALALARAGFDVTVAFANSDLSGPRVKTGNFSELRTSYRAVGITLDYVPPHPQMPTAFNDPRSASYAVWLYLQQGSFDVVLFNDNGGQGYFSLLARHTGVFVDPPTMIVVAHGPFDWVLELNALEYWGREPIIAAFMERRCAALADVLVSPSRYLVDWMLAQGWTMPARHCVIQNMVGVEDAVEGPRGEMPAQAVTELVFFGRQEVRKGLELFCDAIDLLHGDIDLAGVAVTFLGKFTQIAGLHSGVYVAERAASWQPSARLATFFDQHEALAYLRRPGVLAVIPSLAENSPCVVAECLQLGLPFVATDSGGTAELIAPEDREACLVAPTPAALAARLGDILRQGQRPGRLAVGQETTGAQWLGLLASVPVPASEPGDAPDAAPPLVSVCLVHTVAAPCAAACWQSVLAQSYPRLEVLVAWDGVAPPLDGEGPNSATPVRMLPPTADGQDAGRDAAAMQAAGDYVLFVDAGFVVLLPGCVEVLVAAAGRTGADILTSCPAIGADPLQPIGQARAFPIGGCLELGGFENCFGEGVVFVGAAAYRAGPRDPAGGDDAARDWLFLVQSLLAGARLEVVPRPLFEIRPPARRRLDAGRTVTSHRHIMRAYRDAPVATFGHIVESMMQINRENGERLRQGLQHVSPAARDIALRMTSLEPNSPEANQAFIAYCGERRFISIALDFALLSDVAHLPEAIRDARRLTGVVAMEAIQRRRLSFWQNLDLGAELRARVRPVAPLGPGDLLRPHPAVAAHRLGVEVGILKAASICPPGTGRIRATASLQPPESGVVRVAIAVCHPHSRLILSDTMEVAEGAAAWSGWVPVATQEGGETEITVTVPSPGADLLDLYLLSGRDGSGPTPEAAIVWRRVVAEVSVNGDVTPSRIERETLLLRVPHDVIGAGTLLTDVSDFPYPVFVPGERTLLHPVPGRLALVHLAAALPSGAHGLRAVVSAGHKDARPIDFAIWIRPSAALALDETQLLAGDGFSGWFTVARPMMDHQFTVVLPRPADAAMDVYLATRVITGKDVYFCHAYWHELWTMERPG